MYCLDVNECVENRHVCPATEMCENTIVPNPKHAGSYRCIDREKKFEKDERNRFIVASTFDNFKNPGENSKAVGSHSKEFNYKLTLKPITETKTSSKTQITVQNNDGKILEVKQVIDSGEIKEVVEIQGRIVKMELSKPFLKHFRKLEF